MTEVHETEETTTTDIDAEMEQQTILVNVAYTVTAEAGAQYVNLARTELYERASYFAKIVAKDGDTYTLEDADGNTHTNVPRSVLHKRKWISEAYCCFSDDKQHDTWQTQYFMNEMLTSWHQTHGAVFNEKITYVVHSDNAAQHFHSVKAMYWLSELPDQFDWIGRANWAFGCPGHGKGPWDGLGALIKTMLRHDITTGQRINSPKDCYNHIKLKLGDAWAQQQQSKGNVISRMTVLYAEQAAIKRPTRPKEYSKLVGISAARQFMRTQKDCVAMRRAACWCRACINADGGKAGTGMDSYFKVYDCVRGEGTHDYDFCEWNDFSITVFTADIRQTRQQCEEQGRKLADPKQSPKNMKPGNFVVVQAGDIRDRTDVWWLGKTVDAALNAEHLGMPPPAGLEPGTAVFKKCTTADETLPCGQKMTKDDFAVALRWLERIPVGRDPQRLTFEDDDSKKPQLVNAASFVRVLDPSAKEITKKAVLRSVQGDARAARSARGAQSRRIITTWAVSDAAERQALAAMHSDVVGL